MSAGLVFFLCGLMLMGFGLAAIVIVIAALAALVLFLLAFIAEDGASESLCAFLLAAFVLVASDTTLTLYVEASKWAQHHMQVAT